MELITRTDILVLAAFALLCTFVWTVTRERLHREERKRRVRQVREDNEAFLKRHHPKYR